MSLTSLMVYVNAYEAESERIGLAGALADRFDAALIGLSAMAVRPPAVVDDVGGVDGMLMLSEIEDIKAKLAERGSWFRSVAASDRRRLEWRQAVDLPIDALARECRSADLVAIGQEAGRDMYSTLNPSGAILKVGRPTLVVPPKIKSLSAERVVVGWKDTREARRAVHDALPLLRKAACVLVVEICEPSEKRAAEEEVRDVVHYLDRHQVRANSRLLPLEEESGAKQLVRAAQDEGADLLVAGAYGHSRLGEWVFGGITQELLTAAPICCLFSH